MKVIIEKCEELINSNNLPAGAEQSRERENKKVEKRQAAEMIKQLPDITPKIGGIVEMMRVMITITVTITITATNHLIIKRIAGQLTKKSVKPLAILLMRYW